MSDHLPECPTMDFLPFIDEDCDKVPCICDRLRACEARLEDEWLHRCDDAWTRGHDTGFRIGVLRGEHGTQAD